MTTREAPIDTLAAALKRDLPLAHARWAPEFRYQHLALAVIDAIWSIGVRYEGVRAVVSRYARDRGLRLYREGRALPDRAAQGPLDDLVACHKAYGLEGMVSEVYQNRQRTASRSGILKAEAVYQATRVLLDHDIHTFQDAMARRSPQLAARFLAIPGQASGRSFEYWQMLAGDDELVKADRHLLRYLEGVMGYPPTDREALDLIRGAADVLKVHYPTVTPALLDYHIWSYQRAL